MEYGLEQMTLHKVNKTMAALKQNGINPYFVQTKEEAVALVKQMLRPNEVIAIGGSKTVEEVGILDVLRSGDYQFLDRKSPTLTMEEKHQLERQSFLADTYITGTNAVTMSGELYNVDGNGNRVAALNFGPDRVILLVGINKIVENVVEAEKRLKTWVSPALCMSLGRKTPCAVTGVCADCASPERICNLYSIIRKQRNTNRMHLIFINDTLGY